jgi:hypothetical protein
MTGYKKALLEIIDEWNRVFFSKHRDAEEEAYISALFNKFKYQVETQDEVKVMFILLTIMMSEGVMLNGKRTAEGPGSDA